MTKREKQVIELIADGFTNKEIAQKLHLSTYTVKSHVHNILEKLALIHVYKSQNMLIFQTNIKLQSTQLPYLTINSVYFR